MFIVFLILFILLLALIFFQLVKIDKTLSSHSYVNDRLIGICEDIKSELQAKRELDASMQASNFNIEENIQNISYVMDIIYKYQLPDEEQRKLLDQIKIDNERFG